MISPANPESTGDAGRFGFPSAQPPSDMLWNSRIQWGAILAGSFAGFAAMILMTTLGAALGITAGAAGINASDALTTDMAEKAATGLSIGAAIWILLTALATGLAGGWVLNSCARRDRPYSSFIFGGITWAVGLCILLAVFTPGIGGLVAGAGGTAGATVAAGGPPNLRTTPARPGPTLSDEDKLAARDAAEKASAAAAAFAWVTLGAQLISIAATMFAAGWQRHTGTRVVTEVRPRPAPTA